MARQAIAPGFPLTVFVNETMTMETIAPTVYINETQSTGAAVVARPPKGTRAQVIWFDPYGY